MHVNTLALLTSTTFARFALAAWGHGGDRDSPYHTSCSTQWGWASHDWKTHWTTSYTPCTTTKTVTSLVTTTLSTSTSTVTVAASSGFIPVQSQSAVADEDATFSYSGSGGPDPVSKRDVGDQEDSRHLGRSENKHVEGVWCTEWRPGKCRQSTKTLTSTTAVTPVSTTSVYAACATNNLADTSTGLGGPFPIVELVSLLPTTITSNDVADSAYDCCVLALQTANSAYFAYTPPAGASGSCSVYVLDPGLTCNGQNTTRGGVDATYGGSPITVGNSYCGMIIS